MKRIIFIVTIFFFWGCEKVSLDTKEEYPLEMKVFLSSFSAYHRAWDDQEAAYEAWPLGQLWYDASNSKVCQVYNSRSRHVDLQYGNVLFRNKDEYGNWSTPSVVASWTTDSYSKRCHGAGLCANGDYIALVVHEEKDKPYGYLFLYRSKDSGISWRNDGAIIIDGEKVFVGESTCVFKTSSNRLLSYASVGLGVKNACVIYSDDDGHSWEKTLMPNSMGFLEGTFVQMSDGGIYCIARQLDRYCYPNSPQMSFSSDNGLSWKYVGDTFLKSTDAPVSQIRIGDYIYMLYGDRWPNEEGRLSLYFNWATEENYKKRAFKNYEFKLTNIDCIYNDFSYPALVETLNTIQGTFYCREDDKVGIYEMMAKKPKVK